MSFRFSGLRKLGVTLVVLVAVGIGGAAVHTWFGTRSAEQQFSAQGEFVEVSTGSLHYTDVGSGQAVVLLHGASSNLREFESGLQPLFAAQHRVLSFDRPGYGYSDRDLSNWPSPKDQAQAIHEALRAIGVERPVLVGHSWSGSVVLAYALAYPHNTRAVVSLAGATHPWKGDVAWHVALAQQAVVGDVFAHTLVWPIGQLIAPNLVDFVFWPEAPPANYATNSGMPLATRPRAFRSSSQDVARLSEYLQGQSPQYGQISVPVLLFTGTHDHVVPAWNHATRVKHQLPQAELKLFEGAGHALHYTRAAEIVTTVAEFLTRHP